MTKKYNKNLMTLKATKPMIKEKDKNLKGKRQGPQYMIVSNYLNNLKSLEKTTLGTVPNVKISYLLKNKCKFTRLQKY